MFRAARPRLRGAMLLSLLVPLVSAAQDARNLEALSSVSISGWTRPDADLDGGGDFRASSIRASATLGGRIAPRTTAAIGVEYEYEDWRFSTPGALGPVAPWSSIVAPSIDLNVRHAYSERLAFFVGPQVGWTYESGASTSDAISYGAAFGASYVYSPTLVLGLGAGVFRQIDQTRVFPYVLVNWQIDDKWRLANPLSAGPTGGPGLELAYAMNERVEIALGAAYREVRFRLSADGPTPDGIGVDKGVPIFVRLTYQPSRSFSVGVYAGALVGGELRVLDRDGATLLESDYKTSPILAISARYGF